MTSCENCCRKNISREYNKTIFVDIIEWQFNCANCAAKNATFSELNKLKSGSYFL